MEVPMGRKKKIEEMSNHVEVEEVETEEVENEVEEVEDEETESENDESENDEDDEDDESENDESEDDEDDESEDDESEDDEDDESEDDEDDDGGESEPSLEVKDANGILFNGDTGVRWKFDPEQVVILGLDDNCDDDDPLADDGVRTKLDEAQIKSVARDGVIQDILICAKNINGVLTPVVVDGRHRTRWARAANQRGLAKNTIYVHARCVSQKVPDEALRVGKHTLNYVRANRNILSQAKAAKELSDAGRRTADIAVDMGVSVSTIENFLALANASKPLLDAVTKGSLPITAGYKLAKLDEAKQIEAVKEMLSEAKASKSKPKVADAAKAKARAKGNKDAAKRPGIGKIRKLLKAATEDEDVREALSQCEPIDFLRWLLGDVSERVLPAGLRPLVRGKKKSSEE
jgi:hypothetical protein